MAVKISKVALVVSRDHAEGVQKAVRLLDINAVKGRVVAFKANCNTADPFPASTHHDALHKLITMLQQAGASHIVLAERSGPARTEQVLKEKGIYDMAKKLGFTVINLDTVKSDGWVHRQPKGSHWQHGFNIARAFAEAECLVQTCCLKTHMYGGHFTMSLKNSVGMVERSFMGELHSSRYQRQMIAEINTAYTTDLIVMDGIEAFVRGGPMEGEKAKANVVFAGNDRIAIDAAGVAMLRLLGTTPEVTRGTVFEQDQIARAVELGIGVKSPEAIQFVTDSAEAKALAEKLKSILLTKKEK